MLSNILIVKPRFWNKFDFGIYFATNRNSLLNFWNIETSILKNFSIFFGQKYVVYVFVFFLLTGFLQTVIPLSDCFVAVGQVQDGLKEALKNTLPLTSAPSQIRAQNFKTICEIYLTKGTKWPKMMNNPASSYGSRHAYRSGYSGYYFC